MVWTTNKNLQVTSAGGAVFDSLMQNPEQLIGQPVKTCFALSGVDTAFFKAHEQSLAGRQTSLQQIWNRKAYSIYLGPLTTNGGTIEGCVGVAIDVTPRQRSSQANSDVAFSLTTSKNAKQKAQLPADLEVIQHQLKQTSAERRQIESALRCTQHRIMQLAASIDSALWIYDVKHDRPIYLSPVFENIWKMPLNTVLCRSGHPMLFDAHPDDVEKLNSAIATQKQGRSTSDEFRIRRTDGHVRWIRARAFPIVGRHGKIDRIAGIAEDITARRAEEELQRRNDRLATLGSFSAGIAHEVNNPLGAALLSVQGALRARQSETEQVECLEHALNSIRKCSAVVKSLLRFCREEPASHYSIDLNEVLQFAEAVCRTYAMEHHCELCFSKVQPKLRVFGSPIELEMVIVNLLRNAIEAESTRIEIHAKRIGKQVQIIVSDNGHGIEQAHESRLCDPFFTTRRTEGGAGLGLSIVFAIVQDHGGKLQFTRSKNGGTDVVLHLPQSPSKKRTRHET